MHTLVILRPVCMVIGNHSPTGNAVSPLGLVSSSEGRLFGVISGMANLQHQHPRPRTLPRLKVRSVAYWLVSTGCQLLDGKDLKNAKAWWM